LDTYRNYFCRHRQYFGKTILQLFSKAGAIWGAEDVLYSRYMESLVEAGCPDNTRETYGRAVSHFRDYIQIVTLAKGMGVAEIKRAYLSYNSYLTLGPKATESTAKLVYAIKPRRTISLRSSGLYHAAIDDFLYFCKDMIAEAKEFAEQGLELQIPSYELVIGLSLSASVTHRAKSSKYDVGLGSKKVRSKKLSSHVGASKKTGESIEPHKFFPLDKTVDLIESATSWRNGALWALLAGTSVRVSEAMQLLWDDIDFVKREIRVNDPAGRADAAYAYRGLTEGELSRLCWKGRTTSLTFILEPYGAMFFENLEMYRDSGDGSAHNFVFQTTQGKPLFLTDYGKVVLAPFKKAARPIYAEKGLSMSQVGLHSLRHGYIYFMRNFVEFRGGYGLSPHELMCLTGHADIKSLETYGRVDRETLFEQLGVANVANMKRFGHAIGSNAELHVQYLEQRILDWKAKVQAEQAAR
jgi:integrase